MIRSARIESKTLTEAAQNALRVAIAQGTYRPGSQLPTEAELGEQLGVSRTVVREALRALQDEGLIMRRHGVGTFVRDQAILKNLNFNYGITEMIESAGLKPGTTHLAVLHTLADADCAVQLRLPEQAPLVTVERVRTADGRPVVFSQDTVSGALLERHAIDLNRLLTESIYDVLQADLGQLIEYGVARIAPVAAPEHVADKLGLAPGAMVLSIVQTDYSAGDEPLLYSCEYHLPDAFDFVVWRRGPAQLRTIRKSADQNS
jgi:GntR family transcriptional regulator